jgi:hypothetical protein
VRLRSVRLRRLRWIRCLIWIPWINLRRNGDEYEEMNTRR